MRVEATNERAVIGGNNPPVTTAYEKLRERQSELVATASAWLKELRGEITTEEQAVAAKGFKDQLYALQKEADAGAKAEAAPYKAAAETIRDRYAPIGRAARICMDMITPLSTKWLVAEQARKDAEAAAARAEAEARRKAAEEAQRAAEQDIDRALMGDAAAHENTMANVVAAEEKRLEAEAAEKRAKSVESDVRAKVSAPFTSGGVKRAQSLRTVYDYRCTDVSGAVAVLLQLDDCPEIAEACVKIMRRLHTKDRALVVAGMVVTEEQRAV